MGLSRWGYAEARRFKVDAFYYLPPADSMQWCLANGACIIVFSPLNAIDRCLGTGMTPDPYTPIPVLEERPDYLGGPDW
jgi:hypothetical protein